MSKHSSIFSVSIPTREQRTDADKMAFPQPVGGGWVGEGGDVGGFGVMEGEEKKQEEVRFGERKKSRR